MVYPRAFLDDGLTFQGRTCPALAMGLRAGAIAMNRLGIVRSEGNALLAMVELGDDHGAHCFGDGVQAVTGCAYGKGNMRQLGYGKYALTLVDAMTSRAVRVVLSADKQVGMRQQPFYGEYRLREIPFAEMPDEVVDPLIEEILTAPEAVLFDVRDVFAFHTPPNAEDDRSFVCWLERMWAAGAIPEEKRAEIGTAHDVLTDSLMAPGMRMAPQRKSLPADRSDRPLIAVNAGPSERS